MSYADHPKDCDCVKCVVVETIYNEVTSRYGRSSDGYRQYAEHLISRVTIDDLADIYIMRENRKRGSTDVIDRMSAAWRSLPENEKIKIPGSSRSR